MRYFIGQRLGRGKTTKATDAAAVADGIRKNSPALRPCGEKWATLMRPILDGVADAYIMTADAVVVIEVKRVRPTKSALRAKRKQTRAYMDLLNDFRAARPGKEGKSGD